MPLPPVTSADGPVIRLPSQESTFPYSVQASRAVTICIAVGAALISFYPFFSGGNWMRYEEDDFFYYLKTASNFAHGLGSAFSGVPTNGYHPLWFILLAAVSRVSSPSSDLPVRIFLSTAILTATLVTYFLSRKLLPIRGMSPLLTNALAGCISLYALHIYSGGMEIILTIPLVFAVALAYQSHRLWDCTFWPAAGFGLLLSALFLSRLDTGLLISLLAIATVIHPKLRSRVRSLQFAGIVLGFSPASLYLISNHIFFHTWLPISGMAKQLKSNHLPSWSAWHSLLHQGFQGLFLIPIIVAIILIPAVYRNLTETQQVIYPLLLIFPFVYVLILSCLSDWNLWFWYFYCQCPALCVSCAVLLLWQPTGQVIRKPLTVALIALAVPALLYYWRRKPSPINVQISLAAVEIRDFALTHPGIYAMGDRAGMVGYLLSTPVIQTEGLVMDRKFLKLIQDRTPLREALAHYRVRYYVSTSITALPKGCYHAVEPSQAGPNSPHMVADFCQPPVASYSHSGIRNFIFDLDSTASTVPSLP
jgi:hypothetical protein